MNEDTKEIRGGLIVSAIWHALIVCLVVAVVGCGEPKRRPSYDNYQLTTELIAVQEHCKNMEVRLQVLERLSRREPTQVLPAPGDDQ